MPTCPGCGRRLSHQQLETHERHCPELTDADRTDPPTEDLDHRLTDIERRLDQRVRELEALVQEEFGDAGAEDAPSDSYR